MHWIPKVYEAEVPGEQVPAGFNAVRIAIDGYLRASLDWKEAQKCASRSIEKGFKLFWEIDLGLGGKIPYPYGNAMQHQALQLALEQFRDTLWAEFRHESLGLALYRGSADPSSHFVWDDQQQANFKSWLQERKGESRLLSLYCSGVLVDYMKGLATPLPDTLPLYVLLDCSGLDLFTLSQLTSRERYDPFHLILKASPFADQELAWQEGSSRWGFVGRKLLSTQATETKIALVLPPYGSGEDYPDLCRAMVKLKSQAVPFRVIPERHLAMEWDQLDRLLYSAAGITPEGKRMLQGFSAAGGEICQLMSDGAWL
jgi:hypothetical protein